MQGQRRRAHLAAKVVKATVILDMLLAGVNDNFSPRK